MIFDFHHPLLLVSLFIYSLDDKEVFMSQKRIPYQKEIVKIPEEI